MQSSSSNFRCLAQAAEDTDTHTHLGKHPTAKPILPPFHSPVPSPHGSPVPSGRLQAAQQTGLTVLQVLHQQQFLPSPASWCLHGQSLLWPGPSPCSDCCSAPISLAVSLLLFLFLLAFTTLSETHFGRGTSYSPVGGLVRSAGWVCPLWSWPDQLWAGPDLFAHTGCPADPHLPTTPASWAQYSSQ